MALVKNVSNSCFITLNSKQVINRDSKGEIIDVLPGKSYKMVCHQDAVEVPDELLETPFAQAHIEAGDLVVVGESKPAINRSDLIDMAEAMGIEVNSRWSNAKIQKEIDKLGEGA